ncbi:MAG: hypothetical protein AVDCRST_MAG56-6511 [uncultured Cytophagales bacterium]|uniref:Uncharacterized protein n=1 Tax=uncultured Cytophagales bacterium TaxID=158755 RepID=A0A6J4KTM4_9SPHI|nr:MAG: hypothetical protein AVDCRST_MAG56-6511 [uncultured Cytophagales bacterium]
MKANVKAKKSLEKLKTDGVVTPLSAATKTKVVGGSDYNGGWDGIGKKP